MNMTTTTRKPSEHYTCPNVQVVNGVEDLEYCVGKIVRAESGNALYEREHQDGATTHRLTFVPHFKSEEIKVNYGDEVRVSDSGVSVFYQGDSRPFKTGYCKMSTNPTNRHMHDLLSDKLRQAGAELR